MSTELVSLKGCLPFRISTTSYIIADTLVRNVLFSSRYVDEIELIFFETPEASNYPANFEINELKCISEELAITYSVHLPAEVFLGDPDPKNRQRDCDKLLRFYERTLPLDPKSFILHLDRRGYDRRPIDDVHTLMENFQASLDYLEGKGMALERTAAENLDYSLSFIEAIVNKCGMGYCLDLGHVLFYGLDLEKEIQRFLKKSPAVHLHGTVQGMDHRSLEGIAEPDWKIIKSSFTQFHGSVSIEVFSLEDLAPSLERVKRTLLTDCQRNQ